MEIEIKIKNEGKDHPHVQTDGMDVGDQCIRARFVDDDCRPLVFQVNFVPQCHYQTVHVYNYLLSYH
ncbi:hypothetical protein T4D_13475 [Trichinella pseudospiralis]|uniref:Uncharacterized protein n=1 Tax=Trichinella pseudospiralis TaxID=6337 RepID=A0A0V1FH95_TRIPS|nr:hypothetical protein T4D_4691 [Trichinella pseudospiralis]KRY84670.1 hypothetical protein T4D_13475 [Trichinella pseudospiralis]